MMTIIEWMEKSVIMALFLPSLNSLSNFLHSSFLALPRRTSKKMLVSMRYIFQHFVCPKFLGLMLKFNGVYVNV